MSGPFYLWNTMANTVSPISGVFDQSGKCIAIAPQDGGPVTPGPGAASYTSLAALQSTLPAASNAGSVQMVGGKSYLAVGGVWEPIGQISTNLRAPAPTDNAAAGFDVNNFWRVLTGLIYQPVDAVNGIWKALNKVGKQIGGVVPSASIQAAYGTEAVVPGYTGNLIDVTCKVGGADTTVTVAATAGVADYTALESLLARSDSGTPALVVKAYDQSGNARHATTGAGAVSGGILVWRDAVQKYVVTGDQSGLYTLQIPAAATVTLNSFSLVVSGNGTGNGSDAYSSIGQLGGLSGAAGFWLHSETASVQQWVMGINGVANTYPTKQVPAVSGPGYYALCSGASTTFASNEISSNGPAMAATSVAGGALGPAIYSGMVPAFEWCQYMLTNAALTAAQLAAVKQSVYNNLSVTPQALDTVVVLGDSRATVRASASQTNALAPILASRLNGFATVIGHGISGATPGSLTVATVPAFAGALAVAGRKHVAVVLLDINCLMLAASGNNGAGLTVAQTVAALQAFYAALRSAGFTHIVALAGSRTTNGGTNGANGSTTTSVLMGQLYTAVMSLGAPGMGVDALVDLSASAATTSFSNGAYSGDGVHPTSLTLRIWADLAAPAVLSVLAK
jgi:hypothetical protein